MQTPYRDLTTAEVKAKLDQGELFRFIDVRETRVYTIAHIDGAELLPLSQAQQWVSTLPQDAELVFFCHHGGRSAQVVQFLVTQLGYTRVANMAGGIDDWSLQIDPTVPRY